jgi:hypothetical protein
MNLPSGHRPQQQKQQQKTLQIKKRENTLDYNSRLIEALVATSQAVCDFLRTLFNPCDRTTATPLEQSGPPT